MRNTCAIGCRVLKFGGTSVGSVEMLQQVRRILAERYQQGPLVVVVSAVRGVTDFLLHGRDASREYICERMVAFHRPLVEGLLQPEGQMRWQAIEEKHVQRLWEWYPLRYEEEATWITQGECWSADLVALLLQEAGYPAVSVDAAACIQAVGYPGKVEEVLTYERIRSWYASWSAERVPVVTGFRAGTPEGRITTLGRGGSDYTAALFAAALQAEVLERWTDVDGVYERDPRQDKEAQRFAYLSLEEACRWNEEGLLGMHPRMFRPLLEAGIPVHIRCTRLPEAPGTVILPQLHQTA